MEKKKEHSKPNIFTLQNGNPGFHNPCRTSITPHLQTAKYNTAKQTVAYTGTQHKTGRKSSKSISYKGIFHTKNKKNHEILIFFSILLAWYIFLIYLCTIKQEETTFLLKNNSWRGGRVVDCTGLENRRTERYRGFESLSLRKKSGNNESCFLILFYRDTGNSFTSRHVKQNQLQTPSGVF